MSSDRPNDPIKVDYGPARPTVIRGVGVTESERYLAKLADRSFLDLWSYPNTFIDKRPAGGGDGKELCDLLVVCGDHVLIFSDKTVGWPHGEDEQLAWRRWYKRAILKSIEQVRGAKRWISNFPDRIFLDRKCTQRLPLQLPPTERRKLHRIVVARGAGDACQTRFAQGSGSLHVSSVIRGDDHWNGGRVEPFTIGDVDPSGPFVHVLDDTTLEIVMTELDTITDFTAYLEKKERLFRSGVEIQGGGEEELLANYLVHMSSDGEHDFAQSKGESLLGATSVSFDTGGYSNLLREPLYLAKKDAYAISYVWDKLIASFTKNMMGGTTIIPDGGAFILSELEEGIRLMALVPRYLRRVYSEAILDALQRSTAHDRFARALMPGPTERNQDTGFFFMTLAVPNFQLSEGYEQYRTVRRRMLETYAFAFLQRVRTLKQIVGIATEAMNKRGNEGSSEDMIVVWQTDWSPDFLKSLEERKAEYGIVQEGNLQEYAVVGNEFPDVLRSAAPPCAESRNRRQRRASAAEAKRQRKGKREYQREV